MASALRKPWIVEHIHYNLKAALKRRDEESLTADEILDTIGPSGELRLPDFRGKPVQVISVNAADDPCTVVLSDKAFTIVCKISSDARQKYETSSGTNISTIKGGIIKLSYFDIYFFKVDGKLFWEGATYQSQIGDEPASQKGRKPTKKGIQSNNMANKSMKGGLGIGNKYTDAELFHMPKPVFFITDFIFLSGQGSELWGNPRNVSSRPELRALLLELPRKARSSGEIILSQSGALSSRKGSDTPPAPSKCSTNDQGSDTPSTPSKCSTSDQSSDNDIRSQTDIHSGGVSSQDVSQLPFTTQVHAYMETYDDFRSPERSSQKKKSGVRAPQSGLLGPSVPGKKNMPKAHAHHARKNAEKTKSLNTKPKLINYADGSDSEGPFISSAVGKGDLKDLSAKSNSQNKRKRGDLTSSFSSLDVGRKGMKRITASQTIIPKDQQEILDRPESWYPYKKKHHVSGYDFVSKAQLVPKSHPPRDFSKSNIQVIVPPVRSPVSSPITEISWPTSSVKSPPRYMNAVPPDSSFRSDTQSPLAGRWSKKTNFSDAQVSSNDGSFNQPSQISIQGLREEHVIPCAQTPGETHGRHEFKGKRVTRAANGISKKTPVDPNNVEPSRMAKASKKQKLAVVRKQRPRHEYHPEEDESHLSSGDENINELINHPNLPVGVVDPNGRTRVAVFGSILKAQQVNLWVQNGKQSQKCQDEDENDARSNTDYDGDGDGGLDDKTWDKQLGSDEEVVVDNKATEVPTKEVVGATVSTPLSPRPQAKQLENQQHTENMSPVDNVLPDSPVTSHSMLGYHSVTNKSLPSSQQSGMLLADGGNKTPEALPQSSIELPMAEHLGVLTDNDEDEDEIPQAPLMPLNPTLNCTAKALDNLDSQYPCPYVLNAGPTETAKRNSNEAANSAGIMVEPKYNNGDSFSTALSLQDPSAPEAINISGSRRFDEGVHATSAPPSPSISSTAPSIQVEETPYGKGAGILGEDLSPTIAKSKSRIDSVCDDEGLDLMLVPGTVMEKPDSPQEFKSPVVQNSPTTRLVTIPEKQMTSQNLSWPSVESTYSKRGSPDDLARSQEQLLREAQEHQKIEVPATSEPDQISIEDDILLHCTAARQVPRPGPRQARKVLKVVAFGTQEIRAAANTRNVTNILEEQKREFMGFKELPNFAGMAERENTSMNESPGIDPKAGAPKDYTLSNFKDQSPTTPSRLPRSNDEEMASGVDQSNIRKRAQSSPPKKVIAAKKLRIDVPPYKTARPPALPPSERQRNFKAPATPRAELSPKSGIESLGKGDGGNFEEEDCVMEDCVKEGSVRRDFEEKDLEQSFELSDDDPMAGFPDIDLGDDEPMVTIPEIIDLTSDIGEYESPRPSPTQSRPELYAGLRMRDIHVPGYERLTAEQKIDLDRRRQEYFGVKTSSERLFSMETQRAMAKADLKLRGSKEEEKDSNESPGNEWYRDKDTPVKKFFRKFQEMERSRMEKAALNKSDE